MESIKPELDQIYDLLRNISADLPNNILAKRDTIVDLLANSTLLSSLKYPEQINYLSKIIVRHLPDLHDDRRQIALASVLLMSSFIDQTRLGMNYNIDRLPKPVGMSIIRKLDEALDLVGTSGWDSYFENQNNWPADTLEIVNYVAKTNDKNFASLFGLLSANVYA